MHWRTGIALGAAREKVRVAHALATLPIISATMERGAISYAKVRALTRVATPENEAALLDFAQAGTAAHVERFVRRVAAGRSGGSGAQAESRHLHRQLSTWVDDDGMVVIRGRLTPEVGAVVQRALEAAANRLFREAQATPKAERLADEVTTAQRRADALGLLAEAALTSDLDRGSAGDRYQVVLHVDVPTGVVAGEGLSGTVEVEHGAVDVSAETSRRISCDASVVRDACTAPRRGPRHRAARHAPCRPRSGGHSRLVTGVADSRAARPAAATRITSSTGSTAARPASTTSSCCVDAITGPFTRAGST